MGCAAMPKTFDEGLKAMDAFADAAEKQGASWYVDLTIDGDPSVIVGYAMRADSSMVLRMHAQGNAQSAAKADENPTSGDE